jgi:hypothetical protein
MALTLETQQHYKGGFKNLDPGHLAGCMRQLKPQRTDLLGEDNIIYHLKANRLRWTSSAPHSAPSASSSASSSASPFSFLVFF